MHYDEENDVGRLINCTLFAIAVLWVAGNIALIRDCVSIWFR